MPALGGSADRHGLAEALVRLRDHVHRRHLADPRGRRRAGVGGRLHRRHVAAHDRRHEAAADRLVAHQLDVRGLDHRVARLDGGT